jgi:hypothetical protein
MSESVRRADAAPSLTVERKITAVLVRTVYLHNVKDIPLRQERGA